MEELFRSFQYGIVPTFVVLIYLIVVRILDTKKAREESKRTIKVNAEILDAFNNLNIYLKRITSDIIDKENDKCNAAIRSSFKAMGQALSKFAVFTIISNNVKNNRDNIIDNINNTVFSEFATIYNELSLYKGTETDIITSIKDEWKDELFNDLKNIIFDTNLDKESKIYTIHNKLNLRINNYISFVQNKILEK